jgi:hypothetical protein
MMRYECKPNTVYRPGMVVKMYTYSDTDTKILHEISSYLPPTLGIKFHDGDTLDAFYRIYKKSNRNK